MNTSHPILNSLRESRRDIASEYAALCDELDLQKKFKLSVRKHPLLWLGGAAGAGLLSTFLGLSRSRGSAVAPGKQLPLAVPSFAKAGWLALVLEAGKLLYPFLRPLVMEFAQKSIKSTLSKQARPR